MESLPEDLICRILPHMPFSKKKICLRAVCEKWEKAMRRPESHSMLWYKVNRLTRAVGIPSGVMKVLPGVCSTEALMRRIKAQGLEHLRAIWDLGVDHLSACPSLPNLEVLHIMEQTQTLELQNSNFSSLQHLCLEANPWLEEHAASWAENFLQHAMQHLTHLKTLQYVSPGWAGDQQAEDIPTINAPHGCQVQLKMGLLTREPIPYRTAQSLSHLSLIVRPEADCVVPLTQFSVCTALQYLQCSIHLHDVPVPPTTKLTVTFTSFDHLPKALNHICFTQADDRIQIGVVLCTGWRHYVADTCHHSVIVAPETASNKDIALDSWMYPAIDMIFN